MSEAPFRDLDSDGRQERIAALIRDFWPHRMSGAAAKAIDEVYVGLFGEKTVSEARAEEQPAPHQGCAGRTLADLQAEIFEINTANGWFDDEREWDDDIALLHSEVSEMLEAYRDHGMFDATLADTGIDLPKPEGFGSEAADVVVRALDTAQRRGIHIINYSTLAELPPSSHFQENQKVGRHISMLHFLITQIAADVRVRPDLVPLLSYVAAYCDSVGIDLEFELRRKIAYNRTRGHRHGGKRL